MAKFSSKNNQVRFMLLLTEQTQNRIPCMSAVAVGVPESTDTQGPIPDSGVNVHVPRINGAKVLFVTADWSEDRQAYRISHIHCAGDQGRGGSWTRHLHDIGWVTDRVNNRLWNVLGFRLRPNPVITQVVQDAARERRTERHMQASALKYHLDQGVPQEKAVQLVLDASPTRTAKPKRAGYKDKPRRNFRGKQRPRNKHHNKPINQPFAGLNV